MILSSSSRRLPPLQVVHAAFMEQHILVIGSVPTAFRDAASRSGGLRLNPSHTEIKDGHTLLVIASSKEHADRIQLVKRSAVDDLLGAGLYVGEGNGAGDDADQRRLQSLYAALAAREAPWYSATLRWALDGTPWQV